MFGGFAPCYSPRLGIPKVEKCNDKYLENLIFLIIDLIIKHFDVLIKLHK